ncbi:MAG: Lrp/AsnC family transcriptional regulator [Pseudomonadota bacterium]
MVEIDRTDRRILAALQLDADQSLEALGARIGLSRNACWRRIRRLEEAGVIRGRVALCDPAALGIAQTVIVTVRTDRHDADWLERFTTAVREIPEILGAYRTAGETDYVLRARVADVADYDRLYRRLIAKVPVRDISASFVMEELKETSALPVELL